MYLSYITKLPHTRITMSYPMGESALGASVNVIATAVKRVSSYSRIHQTRHRDQVEETDRIVDRFEHAPLRAEYTDEDEEDFVSQVEKYVIALLSAETIDWITTGTLQIQSCKQSVL